MNPPAIIMMALIVVGLPTMMLFYGFHRFFRFREKKLDIEAMGAIEKAAQYAASNAELEARVRVLEKIVTDGGMQTAAQIEALREVQPPVRLTKEASNG